jgi:uncharacterized protein with HEPN domain
MQKNDEVRLRHMLDAGREAVALAQGQRREDLARDRKLALALVKCIEIIGEAASKVSAAVRAEHPSLPWADIVAMRNRLIHAYFDVDLDRVWDTVTDDLPPLVAELQKILPPELTG